MSETYERKSVGEIVRKAESDYIFGTTTHSKYVQRSMYDDLCRIDAYLNSKHMTGDKDSNGRDKPFFNIVTAAVNIWYRATDIDRKNVRLVPSKSSETVTALLANVHLQEWMRREDFGTFLNDWGRSLARYGSSVVKFVDRGDALHCSVTPWNRLIVDTVDFDANPVIEVLELTEAQLRQNESYDQDMVERLCDAVHTRKTLDGQSKDNKADYIKLYEIHADWPLSYITHDEKDEDTYERQMHVISFVETSTKGEYEDFTLYGGREEESPYMLTHLVREDGQTLAIGAVQHLFEAQWMMNHSVKAIKDQLDLASKLIFQTSDGSFVGQNALSAIETGDILIHKLNQPITQVANSSHDISSLQAFGNQWKALSNEIVGISESMLGDTAPAGTAWRQVEALLNESHSLFELMTENKGLYVERMARERLIPFIRRKLRKSGEIAATLDEQAITQIDSMYVKGAATRAVNSKIIDSVLSGGTPTPADQSSMMSDTQTGIQSDLSQLGNRRFFKPSEISGKTWDDLFRDFEWEVECDVTGEASNGKDDMATLTTVLQTIATNPMVLQDKNAKLIFNKILTITGAVSPLELSAVSPQPQPQMQAPAPSQSPLPSPAQGQPQPVT